MNDEQDNQFRQDILDKIKSGKVEMHSRAFLVWRTTVWVLGILLLLAVGGFIFSFMMFTLRTSGVGDLPQFGSHGLLEFLLYFPWLFVPAILLFAWLLERFVRQYSFAYRLPVLYVALVSVVLIVVGGYVWLATPIHSDLDGSALRGRFPIAGGMYSFFANHRPDDFYVGQIQSIKPDGCALMTGQGQEVNIMVDKHTQLYNNYMLKPGDYIEVLGDEQNGNVLAYDIREVPPGNFPPPPPGFEHP